MLLVLFLNLYYEYMVNLVRQPYLGNDPQRTLHRLDASRRRGR